MITTDNIHKKFGFYLENDLEELFIFFKKDLENAYLTKNNFTNSKTILSLLEQNSSVYYNTSVENIYTLNENKEIYKKQAIIFMEENINIYFNVFLQSLDIDILISIIKYMPISNASFKYYLYLVIVLSDIAYSKQRYNPSLKDIADKAFLRYDLYDLKKTFSNEENPPALSPMPPYKEVNKKIKETLNSLNANDIYFISFLNTSSLNFAKHKDTFKDLQNKEKTINIIGEFIDYLNLENKDILKEIFRNFITARSF